MGRGRGEVRRRADERAEELRRLLRRVAQLDGVVVARQQRLELLVASRLGSRAAVRVAGLLIEDRLPPTRDLAQELEVREVLTLDRSGLSRFGHALKKLEQDEDLEGLVRDGARALKRYQHRDLRTEIADRRRQLDLLWRLRAARSAAGPCLARRTDRIPDLETLVATLPLRLHALADWSVDPLHHLRNHPTADGILIRELARESDPLLTTLLVVLLGQRADRWSSPPELPPGLFPAYASARKAPRASSDLLARCLHAQEDPDQAFPFDDFGDETSSHHQRAERLARLAGWTAGASYLRQAVRSVPQPTPGGRQYEFHLRRFQSLANGSPPLPGNETETRLVQAFSGLPIFPIRRGREMVQLFLDWMAKIASHRAVAAARLHRLAATHRRRSPGHLAELLCEAWREADREENHSPALPQSVQRHCLAMALIHPGLPFHLEKIPDPPQLELLTRILAHQSLVRAQALASQLSEIAYRGLLNDEIEDLVDSDLPPALVRRALALPQPRLALHFLDRPTLLESYLDCVERLAGWDAPPDWLGDTWFIQLFELGPWWSSALVLALVQRERPRSPEAAASLLALGQGLVTGDNELVAALEEWNEVRIESRPPELEPLAALLEVPEEKLELWLHHRRLAGDEEIFSGPLLAPLAQRRKEEGQIAFLQGRIQNPAQGGGPDPETARTLLRRLQDPEETAGRLSHHIQRARHTLERSLERVRQESLSAVLDRACRQAAEKLLGHRLPPRLPRGFRDAFHLLSRNESDLPLLRSFLDDVLRQRPLAERDVNRRWLEQAWTRGLQTERWLQGLTFEIEVEGKIFRFATEEDPLHVLRMGSYFGTCLALEEGFNAASTLVNALDVNKHVIYGRRQDGTVVARKLIGATLDGKLAGYHTYASESRAEIRWALHRKLATFANECGLKLDDQATPEVLHKAFWYDDGNEAWRADGSPGLGPPPPPNHPKDSQALRQWWLYLARRDQNGPLLEKLAQDEDRCSVAALFLLYSRPDQTSRPDRWPTPPADSDDGAALLAAEGHDQWVGAASAANNPEEFGLDFRSVLLGATPTNPKVAERMMGVLSGPALANKGWADSLSLLHARLPPTKLVSVLRLLEVCIEGTDQDRRAEVRDLLEVAYLLSDRRANFCRTVVRHRSSRHRLEELARFLPMPELAPRLRRDLAEASRNDAEHLATALARAGGRAEAPRILSALRRWPDSLPLAVAVALCGEASSTEEARRLWTPPLQPLEAAESGPWIRQARTLGSETLARNLRRELSRSQQEGDEERSHKILDLLAQLGQEGFAPEELATTPSASELPQDEVSKAQKRWLDHRADQPSLNRQSQNLFDLVHGPDEHRAQVVERLFDGVRGNQGQRRATAVWLLSEASRLPLELRRRGAELAARADVSNFNLTDGLLAWLWLRTLPPEDRAEPFIRCAILPWDRDSLGLTYLVLRLEEDQEFAALLEAPVMKLFRSHPDRLFSLLQAVILWCEAEFAEPYVEGLLRRLDPDDLPTETLVNWWFDPSVEIEVRFQDLLVEALVSRLPKSQREALVERLESGPRRTWLVDRILGQAPSLVLNRDSASTAAPNASPE